ncbi:PilN domain-containing protein [Methylobacterium marchantiae]|uniref:PilN domain-containing protein n=1 Tax=Methylobacterium marchantiae TaxID=600331 RepID=A0ABW3X4T0_9HYPH|nr:hypothetical protein AIGOOFII_4094 [Methylobacterium marchantiae]
MQWAENEAVGRLWQVLSPLRRVFASLLDSFVALVKPLCARWMPTRRLVFLFDGAGDLQVHRVSGESVSDLGPLTALNASSRSEIATSSWSAVELHLPPEMLLRRSLKLPATARLYLGPILAHRLERLTPWRPDRILYGYRVVSEDAEAIGIEFAAMPRHVAAGPRAAIEALGLTLTGLGPRPAETGRSLLIDLGSGGVPSSPHRLRRQVLLAWGGVTASLAAVAIGSLIWASMVEARSEDVSLDLAKVRRTLRGMVGRAGAPEAMIHAGKTPETSAMLLIDRVAGTLPDDSHLRELQIGPRTIRLVGQSRDAGNLIGILEASGLTNVRFSAPVTREEDGIDSFEIVADRGAASVPEARP